MEKPKFDHAIVEWFDTWTYAPGSPNAPSEGCLSLLRLHSKDYPDRLLYLYTQNVRQQSALETAFITKSKVQFSVEEGRVEVTAAMREQFDRAREFNASRLRDLCEAELVDVFVLRAIWFPVCL